MIKRYCEFCIIIKYRGCITMLSENQKNSIREFIEMAYVEIGKF